MVSPLDCIKLAQKISGAFNDQEPSASDTQDALFLMNTLLSEWQLFRYLVTDLLSASHAGTGAASYTVGPTGLFSVSGVRPDKIDAAIATTTGTDIALYPFMAREGYDRITNKALSGTPIFYFYDATLTGNGTIYFWPTPSSSFTITINYKAYLGQFATLTETITLPKPYITALIWNLAGQLAPFYGQPVPQGVEQRASATLAAITNSVAQVPQAVQAAPSNRAGIYSAMVPGGPQK